MHSESMLGTQNTTKTIIMQHCRLSLKTLYSSVSKISTFKLKIIIREKCCVPSLKSSTGLSLFMWCKWSSHGCFSLLLQSAVRTFDFNLFFPKTATHEKTSCPYCFVSEPDCNGSSPRVTELVLCCN